MNVLYITLDPLISSSSASERNNSIIKGLIELNYCVDIVTIGEYLIPNSEKIRVFSLNRSETYDKITRHKSVKKIVRKVYYKFSLFDNTISLVNSKLPSILKDYYDHIISSSDPKTSHLLARKIIKRNNLKFGKWIQYWGDPLTGDISNKTIWPKQLIKLIERKIYSKSDNIVFVSPFTLLTQQSYHPKMSNRFHFVPIPYSYKKYTSMNQNENKYMRFGYFGSYYSNIRNLIPIYEAFCLIKTLSLKIAGNTDVVLKTTTNIDILDNQTKSELNRLEDETDVFICVLNKKGTQIPGKLYHYAGTSKPIIVVIDGDNKEEVKRYIESFNRFIICENTVDEILAVLSNIRINQKYEAVKSLERKNIAKMIIDSKNYDYK